MSQYVNSLPGGPTILAASKSFDTLVHRYVGQSATTTTLIALAVAVYIALFLEQTPSYVLRYLNSPIVKALVIALALCLLNPNPVLAIAITLGFFAILSVAKEKLKAESFQSLADFKPPTKPDFTEVLREKIHNNNNLIASGQSTAGSFANLYPPSSQYSLNDAIRDAGEKPWQTAFTTALEPLMSSDVLP